MADALTELRTQLAQADQQTNQMATTLQGVGTTIAEIASDIDDLIAKLAAGTPGSQEVIDATAEATALTQKLTGTATVLADTATQLQGVAAKHTP